MINRAWMTRKNQDNRGKVRDRKFCADQIYRFFRAGG